MGVVGLIVFRRRTTGREIVIGQLLDFVVEEIQSNGRVARISVNPLSIQKTQVRFPSFYFPARLEMEVDQETFWIHSNHK
jgi:hypothetical protein